MSELSIFEEEIKSKESVEEILNLVNYSLDELKSIENPSILVMGTGGYFPEARMIKDWAERNKKQVDLTCVDKEVIDDLYIQKILKITTNEYFKMDTISTTFEQYRFDQKYDLILLLRFRDFSLIENSVFANVIKAMKLRGHFIMSGGLTNDFSGYSLKNPTINLESRADIPFSNSDLYKSYLGTNIALKFKKITNEI